ncbi:MAG: hypothetical protein KatS3mg100_149 [Candidatus Parcubacteria bacterium]|nr:MAG: hypothetical protein KatS3mg100_149 [Candidatus Parcubacteria bacterium]
MRRLSRWVLFVLIAALIVGSVLAPAEKGFAAFRPEINYQGKLTDSNNLAVADGNYYITFRLYMTATGGTPIWTESHVGTTTPVAITNGLFTVMLGSINSLAGVNFDQPLWLEVAIGGTDGSSWETLSPRKPLGAVPAAFVAQTAQTLDNLDATQFLRSDTSDTFGGGTLTIDGSGSLAVLGGATFSKATSSTFYATTFGIGSDYLTDITGSGLTISGGALTVSGVPAASLSLTQGYIYRGSAANTAEATSTLFVAESGNIGIGTTSPFARLSVAGNGYVDGSVTASSLTATSSLTLAADTIVDLTGTGLTVSGGALQTTLGTAIEKNELANSGTLAFTWTDAEVADTLTLSGGTIGSNSIAGTLTTTGTLTIGDGGDRIDFNSNTWDVTNGVITGATWQGNVITSTYLDSAVILSSEIDTSAELAGIITDETGSGALVFGTSPTISSPTLSGTITTSGLTANRLVVTNGSSQLTTSITSANVAASVTDETGSGALVFGTSPTITTPTIGTSLTLGADTIADFTGSGLTISGGALTVSGVPAASLSLTQGYIYRGSAANTAEATSTLFVAESGNIGIGTTSPFARLSVAGNGYVDGSVTASSLTATSSLTLAADTIVDLTGTGLTVSGGALQTTLGTAIEKNELANSGTLAFTWTDAEVADTLTLSGGTIGSNSIAGTLTTTGTLTIGDGGDRIDFNSNTWDVTNGVITGATWQGNVITSTYLDSAVILSSEIDTSAELAGIITDETGSGALVFGTSPTISSPTLSGTITTSGLTANRLVVTNGSSQLTTSITSANVAASVTDETGSGALVFGTSPTITTPTIGTSLTLGADTIADFTGSGLTISGGALTVSGVPAASLSLTQGYIYRGSAANTAEATSTLFVAESGNIGIGTTSPFARLSVAGNGYVDGSVTASSLTATSSLTLAADTIVDLTGTGLTVSGGALQTTLGTAIEKNELANSGTLAFTWTDAEVADTLTLSGGTIGSNSIAGTLTTTGTLTIGDGGDRIDINSNTWDVTNGVITGATWQGNVITSTYLDSAVILSSEIDTSAELAGIITDETGSGALVFGTSPTISSPTLSGTITTSGLTANRLVVTNGSSQLTTSITSANVAASVTDETGSGALVFGTSPTITTPTIGTSLTLGADTIADFTGSGLTISGGALTVSGVPAASLSLTQGYIYRGSAANTAEATSTLFVAESGNIGIGTTSPFARLSVAGNGYVDGSVTASSLTATSSLTLAADTIVDLTGTGLTVSGGALQTTLGTAIEKNELANSGTLAFTWTDAEVADTLTLSGGTIGSNSIAGTLTTTGTLTIGDGGDRIDFNSNTWDVTNGVITGATWQGNVITSTYLDSAVILSSEIDTSAELAGIITDETGSGALVFGTSPTISSPTLSGTITTSGLTANRLVVTNGSSQLTTSITSANVAASVTDETGSGALVFGTSPTITTPTIGTSLTLGADTIADFTGSGLTISGGALTVSGVPAASLSLTQGYIYRGSAANTAEATSTLFVAESGNIGIGTTTPGALLDVQGAAQFGTGNVNLITSAGKIAGLSTTYFQTDTSANFAGIITDETGSGALVFGTSPTITTPTIGTSLTLGADTIADFTGSGLTISGGALTVSGVPAASLSLTQGYIYRGSAANTAEATSTLFVAESGNIGIGTTSPFARLSVAGNGYVDGSVTASSLTATSSLTLAADTIVDLTGTGLTVSGGALQTTLGTAIEKNELANSGTLAFTWTDAEVADTLTLSGGTIGSNSIAGTLTTTGTLTIGDGGDRIDFNSNTWDVTNGVITGATWQGNVITSTYLDSAVILSSEIDTSAELAGIITDETGSGALVFGTSPTISSPTLSGTITTSGLTANRLVVTNGSSQLTTSITSANIAASVTDETGTGALVFASSPTFSGTVNFPGSGVWNSSGNVGIGVTSPLARLHAGVAVSDYSSYSFSNTGAVITSVGVDHTAARTNVLSLMRDGTSGVVYAGLAAFDLSRWQSDGVNARTQLDIRLADTDTNTLTDVLSLRSNGNIGIGTTSPFARLSVAGNGYVDGSVTASSLTATSSLTLAADTIVDLTGTGLTVSGGALQTTLGTAIEKNELANSGTLAFTWTDAEVADTLTLSGGTIGSNSIAGTLTTTGTLTIGDGGDRIDFNSNTWDVTNGVITGATWQGNVITSTYLDSAVILSSEIDTSAELAGIITDETGSGALVFGTSPTISSPTLSGTITTSGLTANRLVVTNGSSQLTTSITSANVAASVTDETGSGALVFGTSPTITTPTIGTSLTLGADTIADFTGSGLTISGGALTVSGVPAASLSLTQGYIYRGSAANTAEATSTLFVAESGNIGIGTTSPFARLSVAGNGYVDGSVTASSLTATSSLTLAADTIVDLTGTGLTVSGGALQTTLGTAIEKNELANSGTLAFTWTDAEVADTLTLSGGTIGSNSIAGTLTTTGTLTIGDGGDRIDFNSNTWDVTNGVITGATWQGNVITSTYLDSAVILSSEIDTSAELAGIITDETGSGALVFGTSPTISSPTLSGTITTSGLTANRLVVTNGSSQLTTSITSANVAASVTDETGTGALVFADSPTLSNPAITTALRLPDGSATDPALTFTNDTNTGLYRGGADILRLVTAGQDRVTIDASGNVGIGTTTPENKLHISANATYGTLDWNNAQLQIGGATDTRQKLYIGLDTTSGNSPNGFAWLQAGYHAGAFYNLILNPRAGNVGIGTTAPGAKLQVSGGAIMPAVGNVPTSGIYFPTNPGGGSGDEAFIRYYVESGENTKLLIGTNNDIDDDLSFYQAGAERLTIYNGNIGIGTTSPFARLSVAGNGYVDGSVTASSLTATSSLTLAADTIVDLTGTGLTVSGGALQTTLGTAIEKNELANSGTLAFTWTDAEVADTLTLSGGTIGSNSIAGTLTTTGTLTIGDGGDRIDFNSNTWDVTNGVITGATWQGNVITSTYLDSAVILSSEIDTSAELAGIITDETGSGALVFGTSPTISSPTLSGTITTSGLTANRLVVTNGSSQLTTSITSANVAASVTDETGSGALVFGTSPTITTPTIGTSLTLGADTIADFTGSGLTISGGALTVSGVPAASLSLTQGYIYRGSAANTAEATSTLFVAESGNIGIGITTPTEKLDVTGNIKLSGVIKLPDGTAAAPSLTFTNDTNTGLYRGGNDILRLVTAGQDRVTIDASGNVGIGTMVPNYKLDVNGDINAGGVLRIAGQSTDSRYARVYQHSITVTAGYIKPLSKFRSSPEGSISVLIQVQSKTSGHSGTKQYLFQGGFNQLSTSWHKMQPFAVGRGHGDSTAGFDVYVRQGADGYEYDFGVAANTNNKNLVVTFIDLTGGDTTRTDISSQAEVVQSSAGDVYSHRSMTIEGNVGIGTTTPGARLDVQGAAQFGTGNVNLITSAGKIAGLSTTYFQTDTSANFAGIITDETGSGALVFGTSPTITTPTIGTSLTLGADTIADFTGSGLTISGGALTVSGVPAASLSLTQGYIYRGSAANTAEATSTLFVAESGNIGIGITTPTEKLDVTGNIKLSGVIKLPDGTAAAPSLTFTNDTNTGLYRGGNDILRLVTAGQDRVTIDASGRVGIGTTVPTDGLLDVRGRINTPEIAFRNANGGDDSDPYRLRKYQYAPNSNELQLHMNDDNTERFAIYGHSCNGYGCGEYSGNLYHFFQTDGTAYHAGNVGIGTTAPTYKLDVQGGDINVSANLRTGGTVRMDASGNLSNIGTIASTYLTTGASYVNVAGSATVFQMNGTTVITSSRALQNLTGISSSGTINFSGLTANRLVATDASSNLTTSLSSANLAASITDETGSGALVFGTSPTICLANPLRHHHHLGSHRQPPRRHQRLVATHHLHHLC